MGKESLIGEIVDAEWKMFDRVQNIGGRADCQNDKRAFYILRGSQFAAWDEASLKSYRRDLREAEAAGRNLVELKYAYMMRETDPEYFESIKHALPEVPEESVEIIERLAPVHVRWAEQLYAEHPDMQGIRNIRSEENTEEDTSFETYLRGELMTYSLETLRVYEAFVRGLLEAGGNLSLEIAENHLDAIKDKNFGC